MMGRISQSFFPPRYWQEFEDLTVAVFPWIFGDPSPAKFGRPGQSQHGVDVFGSSKHTQGVVGIQCKRMEERDENNNPFPGGAITRRILCDEYKKALRFRPKLELWILATTAKRDTRIQRAALDLNKTSVQGGSFGVKIWFWDDYVTHLNNYDDLTRTYYGTVLQLKTAHDEDEEVLELFRTAFSRAAFYTSFNRENADHFLDAIRDTQKALNTGELVDRESRHVIRKVIGGWHQLHDASLREGCRTVAEHLKKLRSDLDDAIARGAIIKHLDGGLIVADSPTGDALARIRQKCVDEMNAVLVQAGMTPI
jgi:hypothetical protein